MEATKRQRLESQGWRVGTVQEFLDLTPDEVVLIEMKLALGMSLRERRRSQMTQTQLAQKIQSSQPRVARAEQGDHPSHSTCFCALCWRPAQHRRTSPA